MFHTTFALLHNAGACKEGYRKLAKTLGGVRIYGKDRPIPLNVVLESNGISDALWSLKAVLPEEEKRRNRDARLLSCNFAERNLPAFEERFPEDRRPRQTIAVSRRFALGQASKQELNTADDAARTAARVAALEQELAWQKEQFLAMLQCSVPVPKETSLS